MTNLEELHTAIELLRKQGLEPGDDLMAKVSEREEELIKKEILPVVTEKIEPPLHQIKRELTMVIDYDPEAPVRVRMSHDRRSFKDDGFIEVPPDSRPAPEVSVAECLSTHELNADNIPQKNTNLPDVIVEYHPAYQSFCMPPSVSVIYSFATGLLICLKTSYSSPCKAVTLDKDDEERLITFLSNTRNLRYFLDHVKDPGERRVGVHFACNTVSLKWGKEEKTVNMGDPNNKLGKLMDSMSHKLRID